MLINVLIFLCPWLSCLVLCTYWLPSSASFELCLFRSCKWPLRLSFAKEGNVNPNQIYPTQLNFNVGFCFKKCFAQRNSKWFLTISDWKLSRIEAIFSLFLELDPLKGQCKWIFAIICIKTMFFKVLESIISSNKIDELAPYTLIISRGLKFQDFWLRFS